MPIDAMHKELLIRMSLFLGNKDRGQLGCTAKPFKNLDIEKALCSESVTIDHSLLMKIRCYHDEIKETTANEAGSSLASSERDNDDCNTDYYQSKKPKKTNTPDAKQQETESSATAIKELFITYNAAKHLTNDDLEKLAKLGFIHEKTEVIILKFCDQITDLSPLASCVALKDLYLCYCDQITNLSPLTSCTALTSLNLEDCDQITDLSPLANHPTLSELIGPDGEEVDLTSLSNTQQPGP